MGSRYNVFFADVYDEEINDVRNYESRMKKVLKLAIEDCIAKMEEEFGDDEENEGDEFEFEGYSGNIASGDPKLKYCDEEFTIDDSEIEIMDEGNDSWEFPYDEDWFEPIRKCVEKHCGKWGASLCVKINGRWAIMGFYSD